MFYDEKRKTVDWETGCPAGEHVQLTILTRNQALYETAADHARAANNASGLRWCRDVGSLGTPTNTPATRVLMVDLSLANRMPRSVGRAIERSRHDRVYYLTPDGSALLPHPTPTQRPWLRALFTRRRAVAS